MTKIPLLALAALLVAPASDAAEASNARRFTERAKVALDDAIKRTEAATTVAAVKAIAGEVQGWSAVQWVQGGQWLRDLDPEERHHWDESRESLGRLSGSMEKALGGASSSSETPQWLASYLGAPMKSCRDHLSAALGDRSAYDAKRRKTVDQGFKDVIDEYLEDKDPLGNKTPGKKADDLKTLADESKSANSASLVKLRQNSIPYSLADADIARFQAVIEGKRQRQLRMQVLFDDLKKSR